MLEPGGLRSNPSSAFLRLCDLYRNVYKPVSFVVNGSFKVQRIN